jgi:hemerythrin
MLIWNDQFATGSPEIDSQHRQLIQHLNDFEGLLDRTNPTVGDITLIIKFLAFLEDYVDKHFGFEEQCMESFRCPAGQQNREAHERFRQLFVQHKEHTKHGGFRHDLLVALNRAMQAWVQDHILRVDTQLKPCLARKSA